mmetsp:Transcript_16076/g.19550  ORF Transcript_16076/g.19550 Transcript_16076/m.19550 type:complete len:467 (-) Transcript_16076:82-1482(-)
MFVIMAIVYGCDRTRLTGKGAKFQSRKAFWTVWLIICVIAVSSLRASQRPRILSRDQTEEWKGWMQLMFLLYHYFAEAELYNAIRVYIAAYVWMTGYGNFLYYQKTGNFSIIRVAQSLFRLNFFVILICIVLRNEYMLYYICPMHTAFTLLVWLALRIYKNGNKHIFPIFIKIIATLTCTYCIYDIPMVFSLAFRWQPLKSLLAFHDPLHPEFTDELHEWHFRSGLDRFVWIIGMATAALLPCAEKVTEALDKLNATYSKLFRLVAFIILLLAVMIIPWIQFVFLQDKFSYNTIHPYTSWIPITAYIILRNLLPSLRTYYLSFFAFLGRITLETYILQFHVWMRTTGLNGSPKSLMILLPGGDDATYWLNFAFVSALYIFLSYRVFQLTVDLKDTLVPTETNILYRRSAIAFLVLIFFYLIGRSALALSALSTAAHSTPSLSEVMAADSPAAAYHLVSSATAVGNS